MAAAEGEAEVGDATDRGEDAAAAAPAGEEVVTKGEEEEEEMLGESDAMSAACDCEPESGEETAAVESGSAAEDAER